MRYKENNWIGTMSQTALKLVHSADGVFATDFNTGFNPNLEKPRAPFTPDLVVPGSDEEAATIQTPFMEAPYQDPVPAPPPAVFDANGNYVLEDTHSGPLREAQQFLNSKGCVYRVVTEHHIKIGWVNYYPKKGKILLDQRGKLSATGLQALEMVLRKEGLLR